MNQTKNPAECGCENGDCCPPKTKPKWMKYISILVLLAALSIIIIKVVNHSSVDGNSQKSTAAGTASCCDTTKNDSTQKPCCPKN